MVSNLEEDYKNLEATVEANKEVKRKPQRQS